MPDEKEKRKALYDAVSKNYDLGTFDEFSQKLDDSTKRKSFYDAVGHEFDLGDYNTFENKIGVVKKKDSQSISNGSQISSPTELLLQGSNKLDFLAPDLSQSLKQSQEYINAEKNADILGDLQKAQKETQDFSSKIVGKLNDNNEFVDADNKIIPNENFKEFDIVSVPKDRKLNDGREYPSGFAQLVKDENGQMSWLPTSAPDPSFPIAKKQPPEAVVTGYSQLMKPAYVRNLEKQLGVGDVRMDMNQLIPKEEYNKVVDQNYKDDPLVKEYFTYHKDNDKGGALPFFLNDHPEVNQQFKKEVAATPTQLVSGEGRFDLLNKSIIKAYELDKNPFTPLSIDQMVDAPAFYKNLKELTDIGTEQKGLKNKLDALQYSFEKETDPTKKEQLQNQYNNIVKDASQYEEKIKPVLDFFQKPENARVLELMDKQDKGFKLLNGTHQFFPQMTKEEEMKFQKQHQELTGVEKMLNPIKSLLYGAKSALLNIGQFGANLMRNSFNPISDYLTEDVDKKNREFESAVNEVKSRDAAQGYIKRYDDNTFLGSFGNLVNDAAHMTGSIAPSIPFGGSGLASKLGRGFVFGLDSYQRSVDDAKKMGISEEDANAYGLFNGALMGLIGFGIKDPKLMEGFKPSPNLVFQMINPETREAAAKLMSKEVNNYLLNKGVNVGKQSLKGATEMQLISAGNAVYNELLNNEHGTDLPTDMPSATDFIKNTLMFAGQHFGMSMIGKGEGLKRPEVQDYLVHQAAGGNMAGTLQFLDELSRKPDASIDAIQKTKDRILQMANMNFPKGITPEQQLEAAKIVDKINVLEQNKSNADPIFQKSVDKQIGEAEKQLNEIISNPSIAKEKADESIKPVEDEIKKAITNEPPKPQYFIDGREIPNKEAFISAIEEAKKDTQKHDFKVEGDAETEKLIPSQLNINNNESTTSNEKMGELQRGQTIGQEEGLQGGEQRGQEGRLEGGEENTIKSEEEKVKGSSTPVSEKEDKLFTINGLKKAESKKIYEDARRLDRPTDARGLAIEYLANGGKLSEESLNNDVVGSVKRAELNLGKKEKRTEESKSRDYIDKNGMSVSEIAHSIWDNLPEYLQEKIEYKDLENELIDVFNSYNTRLDAAKDYLSSYSPEHSEQKYYEQFLEQHSNEILSEEQAINKWLEEESQMDFEDNETKLINDLIKQHEYEQQQTKGENQQPTSKEKTGVSEKVSSNKGSEQTANKEPIVADNLESENKGDEEKPPISEPPSGSKIHVEYPETELSHSGLQRVANEFSLEDVKTRDRKSDLQLRKDAENTINEWIDKKEYSQKVESLVQKAENGDILTDKERVILEQHLANISGELRNLPKNSAEFDKKLLEIKRLKEAGEKTRSEAGAALRIPTFLSRPEDLTDYYVREMEVSGVNKLTENQKRTAEKEFNDISEAEKKYQEKIAVLESENNRLKAVSEIKKQKRTNTKKSKEDYVKERKDIIEHMREQLKKSRGQMQSTIIPYANELIAIAPDVAKLVKSIVSEGVDKFEDVVKIVHDHIKEIIPQAKEKDVVDIIAGVYNEKKKTKNELATKIFDLKRQAQLQKKLEALYNGEIPKSEKRQIRRNRDIENLKSQINDIEKYEKELNKNEEQRLKNEKNNKEYIDKELSKAAPEIKALENLKKRTQENILKLENDLNSGNFEKTEKRESLKLDKEAIKLKDQLINLKQEREKRLAQAEYDKKSKAYKVGKNALEILNVPRTVMASADLSAPLRQGALATISHPFTAAKASVEMLKSALSQKNFDRWLYDLKESPDYKIIDESGLYIADPSNLHLSAKEEMFMNNMAEKLPVVGKIVSGSERAYVAYLNKMRVDLFRRGIEAFESSGKTFENSPKLYEAFAKYINASTGRGSLPEAIETASPILNTLFFSPRLIASRLQLLNPMYYTKLPKEVRVMALKDMGKFIGFGLTVLALASLNNADVEDDPRSPDFGKIKAGNTRWDIWGGFQQYIRVASQLISGSTKSSTTGEINELNSGKFGSKTRADVLLSFLRGKLAPVPATAWDAMSGKDAVGNELDWEKKTLDLFTPMIVNDVKEAWKDQGFKSLFTVGVPSALGVGVTTYENSKPKKNAGGGGTSGTYSESSGRVQ